jgi:hypothetical protein
MLITKIRDIDVLRHFLQYFRYIVIVILLTKNTWVAVNSIPYIVVVNFMDEEQREPVENKGHYVNYYCNKTYDNDHKDPVTIATTNKLSCYHVYEGNN